ncbi:hypothetical protein C2869_17495 [Saccharobesus litoralis]|uniref:ABC transport system permease protein n=1 Tax=Saccharobesus litoralis TaxID=2172099 RepID=A0A2S0VV59_9ALTE|nr:ABC transporter permease [Saccharobesus litoralis]AWB68106.1 hypothetical protein C2869_17495 [Saccharobesus litoralis]
MASISWLDLAWCLLPLVFVAFIYHRWQGKISELTIASLRMFVQLLLMGYVLVSLFNYPSPWISAAVITLMLVVAAWIAIRPVRHLDGYLVPALIALGISVVVHLLISVVLVLQSDTWYQPQLIIPLAGMYFANTMNTLSLAAERFSSELAASSTVSEETTNQAKIKAFHTAMIPQINSLLAVGLVALPGMMTGQILSGVSPLVAVRYQIMIMTMVLGAAGLGAVIMLHLLAKNKN